MEYLDFNGNKIVRTLLFSILSSSLAYLGLTADQASIEDIKNLGNVVILTDFENSLEDLKFIPDDNNMAVSATITAIVTNSDGEIKAYRHGPG